MFNVLMAALSDDERNFVEDLYTQYEKKIYGIAFRIVNNKHDAEDVVNTVMINVITNLTKFIGKSGHEIKSQLVIYSRNAAIDVYRKNEKRSEKESRLVYNNSDGEEDDIEIPDNGIIIEDAILLNELSEYISLSLDKLSDDDSDVLKLRLLLDYSSAESAIILNISPNAVNKRLGRAKLHLINVLSEMLRGDDTREQ